MILDGKKCAEELLFFLKDEVSKLSFTPKLAAVLVGENPASKTYLRLKKKKLEEMSLGFELIKFKENSSFNEIKPIIDKLNTDPSINGIIIQLPLPSHLQTRKVVDLVAPSKDVDCLTTFNLGKFYTNTSDILPATPLGVIRLLENHKIQVSGKRVCIIGRSDLVSKPLAFALISKDATITICHSKTVNLPEITRQNNIVITAIGKPRFLTKEYFSQGQTVIDIGISFDENGKLSGDVDFDEVSGLVRNITPVPGGVGPMTIYGLIENLIKLSRLSQINN